MTFDNRVLAFLGMNEIRRKRKKREAAHLEDDLALGQRVRPIVPDGELALVRGALVDVADADVADEEPLLEDVLGLALQHRQTKRLSLCQ